ncbi:Nif3-like dinuclear metal center hexameric protein [Tenacibaculum finnmarkense]|nr:Nif3-like dinuclear metal center hexameric protein [Tenacibaculum finnmarkense]MCG8186161.1 Nif3-like dinuclear metal center hexameric protein [Tenacibaculum finnmarkense genomovar finnmarkense]MCG8244281.1 Nif3-like dinuclear metal center hexameric protein [Tenacibaculum finnmarkense genomovar finnmarkense]MCG8793312.1 Nif3-like dinuclear metal center hexameric protein [Tenacibaculum finnmarkense]MCG8843239.1 Nif3-like dinuclear metal center hexameric protein [Tenacibaculum finnmarkense]MC
MQIKDVTNYIEELAPLAYAESFDNVGLLIGDYSTKVTGVLVTLDTLEKTVDQAIAENCNLIVSFHPIIFSGLKKINGNNYVERVVLKAIQNNIAIYATHTALDNVNNGVSAKMCEVLGLQNCKTLIPKKGIIKKLTTYVPIKNAEKLRTKLFEAGAGNIGNYDNCSFNFQGTTTYKGAENSNPTVGEKGEFISEEEIAISVSFINNLEGKILKTLFNNHPYEEVAYEIITLDNSHQNIGMGMIGEFKTPMNEHEFLSFVKKTFKTDCVRHSELLEKPIKKVAVLGGSGSFAIKNALKLNADAYISADFKYHEFFQAEGKIVLADVGHYESEQFTKNLLIDYLRKKFSTFAITLSEESTNPIHYI